MSFWKRPKFILWAVVLILLVVVMLQNVEPTQIRFLFWSFLAVPKLALILISMALGGTLTLLSRWSFRSRRGKAEEKNDATSENTNLPTLH